MHLFATSIKGVSRSLCQLQSTAVGCLRTGREAAGLRSLLPASICKELVQSWRRASSTKLRLEDELQESGSERTLRRNGDEATPAENPCCLGGVADSGRGTGCVRPGEEANKAGGFLSPAGDSGGCGTISYKLCCSQCLCNNVNSKPPASFTVTSDQSFLFATFLRLRR